MELQNPGGPVGQTNYLFASIVHLRKPKFLENSLFQESAAPCKVELEFAPRSSFIRVTENHGESVWEKERNCKSIKESWHF